MHIGNTTCYTGRSYSLLYLLVHQLLFGQNANSKVVIVLRLKNVIYGSHIR